MLTMPAAAAGTSPVGVNADRIAGVRRRAVGVTTGRHRRRHGAGTTAIIAMAGVTMVGVDARATGKSV